MEYFASYAFVDPVTGESVRLPVGVSVDDDEGYHDTIFVHAEIFASEEGETDTPVASVQIRRVMVGKIIDERRSVFQSMDQIDQFEYEVFEAVWDRESGGYRFDDAMLGDLLIFEHMQLVEGFALREFNINKILDDMVCQVGGGAAVALFVESYANFTRFNSEACEYLEDIGYVRVTTHTGLDVERRTSATPQGDDE